MKKMIEHTYCDRCHKEVETEQISWNMYRYDLCSNCKELLKNMKEEIRIYENKIDEVVERYKFGKYLPKDDEE